VAYGPGLTDRVRALAPHGLTADTSLIGNETVDVALELGVTPDRISPIAPGPERYRGTRATGGVDASPNALDRFGMRFGRRRPMRVWTGQFRYG
jgi:hypothetical protein